MLAWTSSALNSPAWAARNGRKKKGIDYIKFTHTAYGGIQVEYSGDRMNIAVAVAVVYNRNEDVREMLLSACEAGNRVMELDWESEKFLETIKKTLNHD